MTEKRKPAVILLGHGSRVKNAGADMEKVAAVLKEEYGYPNVVYCFMSRLGPHFPETFEKLAATGETHILVIPYFLHTGLHIRLDIPEMIKEIAEKYPHIRVQLGDNLGFDNLLVELVHKRISMSSSACDIRELALPQRDAFPVPPGQCEFVPLPPEAAEKLRAEHADKIHNES